MRDGFASGYLSVGDTGDSARDFEHTYTLPQQSLSLDATNGQTHQTSSRNVNDIQRKTSPNSTIQKPSISNSINGNNK
ncbi:unnamed protein product [Anisakis simplex]|uniref:Uncharacterized protein n=1 Tax=Anisakis simplex TaxID=6269 RepID=A0A0M3KJM9_ANISI|nr:unnamed protein product [Anisakis simplex]